MMNRRAFLSKLLAAGAVAKAAPGLLDALNVEEASSPGSPLGRVAASELPEVENYTDWVPRLGDVLSLDTREAWNSGVAIDIEGPRPLRVAGNMIAECELESEPVIVDVTTHSDGFSRKLQAFGPWATSLSVRLRNGYSFRAEAFRGPDQFEIVQVAIPVGGSDGLAG